MTQPETSAGKTSRDNDLTLAQGTEALAQARQLSQQPLPVKPSSVTVDLSPAQQRHSAVCSEGCPPIPGYEGIRLLGTGAFGKVWLAREEGTGIHVAVKFFNHGGGRDWRFEVEQLARLDSVPGIVQLKDISPPGSRQPYYVMAYVENGSLAGRLDGGPLPLSEALTLFRETAEALAYVHAKGIRHCDLKPANVLLDVRGRALLADFGQAHLSSDASPALGTFFYMAPEQADLSRKVPDTRWDVYGLGALFYAMLTGLPPRYDETVRQELAGQGDLESRLKRYREWIPQAPPPDAHRRVPGMDRDLVQIIDRCLEADPNKRLRDAGDVLAALNERDRRRRRRPVLFFGILAPVLLLLVMAGIAGIAAEVSIWQAQQALTSRLMTSDQVTARLVGRDISQKLRDRIGLLEREAAKPRMRELVKQAQHDTPRSEEQRQRLLAEMEERLQRARAAEKAHIFTRWLIADRQGWVLDVSPTVDFPPMSYSWRDWFSGGGNKDRTRAWEPLRQTYISEPYASTSRDNRMFASLSTPIFDPDDDHQVVGVLVLSIDLEDLAKWIPPEIDNGFAVLLNARGHCLLHQDREKIAPAKWENPRSWLDESPVYQRLLIERQEGQATYHDPIDGHDYLAGYAPLDEGDWGVIIQHDKAKALAGLDSLKRSMRLFALTGVILAAVLIAGLWGWLWWMMREREGVAHG